MRLQWCGAPAPRFGRAAARLPKALDPDNCGAGTNRKFLGRLAPRSSTFDLRNHSLPHLPRIGLWHRPASQKRINADSLSHPRPHENPPDSIGAEHALVNVSCNDRRAEQVTGAEGYGPYRSASVRKPCRHAHAIRPRVIETGNIVEVSLDPQDDALPRHVFHAYTNRPTAGEVGEVRILPGYEIPRAGGYPHTGPAGLGIKHRAVPSIADPRGDGANLVDANRPFTRVRVWAKKLKHAKARLRLSEVAPRPGALDTENQAVPLVLAAELTAANDSLRSKLEVKNWGIRGR